MGLPTFQLKEQNLFYEPDNIFWKLRNALYGVVAQVQCSHHNCCHKPNLFKIKGKKDIGLHKQQFWNYWTWISYEDSYACRWSEGVKKAWLWGRGITVCFLQSQACDPKCQRGALRFYLGDILNASSPSGLNLRFHRAKVQGRMCRILTLHSLQWLRHHLLLTQNSNFSYIDILHKRNC